MHPCVHGHYSSRVRRPRPHAAPTHTVRMPPRGEAATIRGAARSGRQRAARVSLPFASACVSCVCVALPKKLSCRTPQCFDPRALNSPIILLFRTRQSCCLAQIKRRCRRRWRRRAGAGASCSSSQPRRRRRWRRLRRQALRAARGCQRALARRIGGPAARTRARWPSTVRWVAWLVCAAASDCRAFARSHRVRRGARAQ